MRLKGVRNKAIELQVAKFKTVFTGQCFCGCGQQTEIAVQTRTDRHGTRVAIAGLPKRYVKGHEPQLKKGTTSPFFKGVGITTHGYIKVFRPEHPRADSRGYVAEHILVMEEYLGRFLYKEAPGHNRKNDEEVHHKDEVKSHNTIDNLQLMTHSTHMVLHRRAKKLGVSCNQVPK